MEEPKTHTKTPKTLVHEACAKEKLNDRWDDIKTMKSPPTFKCQCRITNSNNEEYIAISDGFNSKKAAANDAALKVIFDIQQKIISSNQTVQMQKDVSNNSMLNKSTTNTAVELDGPTSDTEENMIFGDPMKDLLDFCRENKCGPPQYAEDVIKGYGNTHIFTVTCTTTPPMYSAAATRLKKKLAKRVAAFRLLQILNNVPNCQLNLESVASENLTCLRNDESFEKSAEKNFKSPFFKDFDHVSCLGRGGFGVVFEARKKIDEKTYAVKRIKFPCRDKTKKKVLREVKALANLEHQNIVRFYHAWIESPPQAWLEANAEEWEKTEHDHSQENDLSHSSHMSSIFKDMSAWMSATVTPSTWGSTQREDGERRRSTYNNVMYLFIQQELCQKQTLETWIQEKANDMETSFIKPIFLQIVEAVEYVHSQKLIHRDLKPSNIFFAQRNARDQIVPTVKIGDFGLVTTAREDQDYEPSGCPTFVSSVITGGDLTRMKLTKDVGSRMYMSPEQFREFSYDYKVDIYALGIIFVELLMPMKTKMERYHILSEIRMLNIPLSLIEEHKLESELIRKMISHNPTERPDASSVKAWVDHKFLLYFRTHVKSNSSIG